MFWCKASMEMSLFSFISFNIISWEAKKNPECIRFNCMPESAPWKWFVGWPIEQSMTISGIEILQSMTSFCQCFWKAAGILLFWTKHLLNKYRQEGKTRKILITDPLWYTKETACLRLKKKNYLLIKKNCEVSKY